MWGSTSGALVLLLIVRNFQLGPCDEITVKFVVLLVLLFDKYEWLRGAEMCHLLGDTASTLIPQLHI